MSKTLKQLLDQVCPEIGFDTPSAYIGNIYDENIKTMVALAQRVATMQRELRLQWMVRECVIDLSDGTLEDGYDPSDRVYSYALPTDFYCYVPDTAYQNGRIDPVQLPTTPQTWAYLISRSGPQSLRVRSRFIENRLFVFSPDASQTITFEYISNAPIQKYRGTGPVTSANPVYISAFQNDADIWMLDDPLFELDLKWRYKREKGIEGWQDDRADYTDYLNLVRGRDAGAGTIYPPSAWPYPAEPYTNLWVDN